MEAAHISPELPIRWVVSADRTVEIKEEVTELGCDQANERILQEETPPSSITERETGGLNPQEEDELDEALLGWESDLCSSDEEAPEREGVCTAAAVTGSFYSHDHEQSAPELLQHLFRPRRPTGLDFGRLTRTANKTLSSAMDFFLLFFTAEVVQCICRFTNAYAWRHVIEKPSYGDATGAWADVTVDEMHKFIGLLVYMGVTKIFQISSYWSTESLERGPWARAFMSKDRFLAILAMLHVVDPDTEAEGDCLQELRYLLDHMKAMCQDLYQPPQNMAVDERMVRFKARSGMKQFMKENPTRWGFKLWVLACSDSGYTYDFYVYTGSKEGRVHGLAQSVVLQLSEPLEFQNYHLWFDHYYTSPELLVALQERGIRACGTCNPNRKQFPQSMKDHKKWGKKAQRGDMRWQLIKEGNIVALQWKDLRTVTVLSTIHSATESVTVQRRARSHGKLDIVNVRQPLAIHEYNQHMGGVDRSDQLIQKYSVLISSLKWWKTLFFQFVDIAVVNAYILFQEWRASNPLNEDLRRTARYCQLEFREELARQLGSIPNNADVPSPAPRVSKERPSDASASFHLGHVPEVSEQRRKCFLCYKSKKKEVKTYIWCSGAGCYGKSFCLNKTRNCFKAWHSTEGEKYRIQ
ncbi:piggyBac transposable element-derived protein 4-like [Acipenser oxyrinchus oxyrinchus]|uniref:PiggyBac transposable element-derived protein 4-like n=1 Tax=Acipenser oxyrinchus oxyrinchus TaxID=40147 RepID=A0AAD8CJV2_ACIOX|nr:piggyBac transposable element-derived protein 4-like [Acipenser oxyrinchus oxyrinchus]